MEIVLILITFLITVLSFSLGFFFCWWLSIYLPPLKKVIKKKESKPRAVSTTSGRIMEMDIKDYPNDWMSL